MKRFNKGFTLIEIIIVIIILGVLASVALPKVTAQIDRSRASEAYGILGNWKEHVASCYALNSDTFGDCDAIGDLTAQNINPFVLPPATNFAYVMSADATAETVTYKATNAKGKTGTITMVYKPSTGVATITSDGVFLGLDE